MCFSSLAKGSLTFRFTCGVIFSNLSVEDGLGDEGLNRLRLKFSTRHQSKIEQHGDVVGDAFFAKGARMAQRGAPRCKLEQRPPRRAHIPAVYP